MKLIDASGIRKVFDLAASMKNPVNLSIGQPDFAMPPMITNAAEAAMKQGFNSYTPTQGNRDLIDLLHGRLAEEKTWQAEDLFITSGVSGGIFLAFNVLLNPGDEIILPDPYFVMYKHLAGFLGAKPVMLDTYPDFRIDAAKIEKLITPKTKMIVLNSPANPTGKVLSQAEIDSVIAVAKKHDLWILSDEIYEIFRYTEGALPSPCGRYDKLIYLSGFSKSHAMTGWRLGYCAGPAAVLQEMKKLQQYTFVCAPAAAQKAALKAFDGDTLKWVDERVEEYKIKRQMVQNILGKRLGASAADGAFYAFLPAPQGDAAAFVDKSLANEVLIIPGDVFSEKNTHFRLSFAAKNDVLEKGLNILAKIAAETGA